ncbi:B-box zinc finger protein 20 [Dorcoceras hygrometricum]|uniref:B-box zinc finger protein 20 n=1 Tax=Dorcoceras hygrometricum TaxID=472368 RepID=A0A2Z7AB10_9LAMI|nr:B-box zinc finger protein 20 [Dorcoceras hygrometricum]
MKIQCDVCNQDEASVFCAADEAALCAACDRRVHHANMVAGKHHRFCLIQPTSTQSPICDICKDKRAFLFCHQDRAILCEDCDASIHKANVHTQKHTRFLLTGVIPSSTSSPSDVSDTVPSYTNPQQSKNMPVSASIPFTSKNRTAQCTPVEPCDKAQVHFASGGNLNGSVSASTISEYLMETLPGWHVEDFLDSTTSYGFCKDGGNGVQVQPFFGDDSESKMNDFSAENMGFWVPQISNTYHQTQSQSMELSFGIPNEESAFDNIKSSRKWGEDNTFAAVPEWICPPSTASTRY